MSFHSPTTRCESSNWKTFDYWIYEGNDLLQKFFGGLIWIYGLKLFLLFIRHKTLWRTITLSNPQELRPPNDLMTWKTKHLLTSKKNTKMNRINGTGAICSKIKRSFRFPLKFGHISLFFKNEGFLSSSGRSRKSNFTNDSFRLRFLLKI